MKARKQDQFTCRHCGTSGWYDRTALHLLDPRRDHDRPDGRKCRAVKTLTPGDLITLSFAFRHGLAYDDGQDRIMVRKSARADGLWPDRCIAWFSTGELSACGREELDALRAEHDAYVAATWAVRS